MGNCLLQGQTDNLQPQQEAPIFANLSYNFNYNIVESWDWNYSPILQPPNHPTTQPPTQPPTQPQK